MGMPSDISEPIIESLYSEALVLADEVRAVFDLRPVSGPDYDGDRLRLAMSVEGLRTTTRIMHALAWLLNQRAYLNGQMSAFQLRRHGTLPPDRRSEPANLRLLEPPTCDLIAATEALHARIARLDHAWREGFAAHPSAVLRLRERLGRELHVVSR
jgi:regulator of CtrA degradation